jgi:hypothetical protein
MHVPLGIKDAISEAGFQTSRYRTGPLVYLNLVLAIDESQDVITRNGVTTMLEFILMNVLRNKLVVKMKN